MNNDTPFKLRTLYALTDALKEITPDNGYSSDLSDFTAADGISTPRVYRGRAWFGETDPIPMVSVLEHVEEDGSLFPTPPDASADGYDWKLLVQGFVTDDPTHPTDPAYKLMRDVRRRLIREKQRTVPGRSTTDPFGTREFGLLGCRVLNMAISTGKVRPADDVSGRAYFWMVVTLTIAEDAEEA